MSAMPLPAPHQPDTPALRSVDRARVALRCGEIVAVDGGVGGIALALAVETLRAPALERMRGLVGQPLVLALTRWRAASLGLTASGGPGMVTLTPAVEPTVDMIHALVEPGRRPVPVAQAPVAAVGGADELAVGAVRLTKLAALLPTAVVALVDAGQRPDLAWCQGHDLPMVSCADIADYERHAAQALRQVAEARVPLADAPNARIIAFRPDNGGHEHLAIVIGEPPPGEPVLVRLHSECFTGDILASLRCDCGDQLRRAIAEIAALGSGIVLYLAQEGRGIGLVNKLRAYQLQDQGYDTLDANERLGFDADERVYLSAVAMLRRLGHDRVRLMTNNPDKMQQLTLCGIEVVERVPHIIPSNDHNKAYLTTKALRGGHLF